MKKTIATSFLLLSVMAALFVGPDPVSAGTLWQAEGRSFESRDGDLVYNDGANLRTIEEDWGENNLISISRDGTKFAYTTARGQGHEMVIFYDRSRGSKHILDANESNSDIPDVSYEFIALIPSLDWKHLAVAKRDDAAGFMDVEIYNLDAPSRKPVNVEDEFRKRALSGEFVMKDKESIWGLLTGGAGALKWSDEGNFVFGSSLLRLKNSPEIYSFDLAKNKMAPAEGNPQISPWPDIGPTDPDYIPFLEARDGGWLVADDGGLIRPDGPVTTDALVTMLVHVYTKYSNHFDHIGSWDSACLDVPLGHPHAWEFETAILARIVLRDRGEKRGWELYCHPDRNLTRLEALKMIVDANYHLAPLREDQIPENDPQRGQYKDTMSLQGDDRGYAAAARADKYFPSPDDMMRPEKPILLREVVRLISDWASFFANIDPLEP